MMNPITTKNKVPLQQTCTVVLHILIHPYERTRECG